MARSKTVIEVLFDDLKPIIYEILTNIIKIRNKSLNISISAKLTAEKLENQINNYLIYKSKVDKRFNHIMTYKLNLPQQIIFDKFSKAKKDNIVMGYWGNVSSLIYGYDDHGIATLRYDIYDNYPNSKYLTTDFARNIFNDLIISNASDETFKEFYKIIFQDVRPNSATGRIILPMRITMFYILCGETTDLPLIIHSIIDNMKNISLNVFDNDASDKIKIEFANGSYYPEPFVKYIANFNETIVGLKMQYRFNNMTIKSIIDVLEKLTVVKSISRLLNILEA